MRVLPSCVYVYTTCIYCSWRPEEGVGSSGTEGRDDCELPCELGIISPISSVRTKRAVNSELSLQPLFIEINNCEIRGCGLSCHNPNLGACALLGT